MCNDDWNIDHRRWSKRCLLTRGPNLKKMKQESLLFLKMKREKCIVLVKCLVLFQHLFILEILDNPVFLKSRRLQFTYLLLITCEISAICACIASISLSVSREIIDIKNYSCRFSLLWFHVVTWFQPYLGYSLALY